MKIPTLDDLRPYIEAGLIKATRSTRYPGLTVYNYTPKCTYSGAWDDITRQCRGLILGDNGHCHARPWPKFFNLGEKHAEDPPQREPDSVAVKEDGSLGIGFFYQGSIVWSTRGTLDSDQAKVAQRIWDDRYAKFAHVFEGFTLLCEIVGPETKIILEYPDPDLICLGMILNDSGRDLTPRSCGDFCGHIGMSLVEEVSYTLDELKALKSTLPATAEGYVMRWGDLRLKVKGDAYVRIARVLSGFNERRVGDIWYLGEDLPDCLPEESREWADGIIAELNASLEIIEAGASDLLARFDSPKRMAMVAKTDPAFSIAVNRLRGKTADPRLVVYRARFGGVPRK